MVGNNNKKLSIPGCQINQQTCLEFLLFSPGTMLDISKGELNLKKLKS